ncbi:PROTEIN MIZU-KUSSEI 1 [Salix koriyanagi]|uniref:PROTEIN MIZU-KUSSEI 1 n=1 Tax=Salix koriyanagi TaxID=2511006 RepID=A0A9Q0TBM7_9ROSI|nr:PROTEIN MIZU-KUSSEI 1 [Salix koriyanagi]
MVPIMDTPTSVDCGREVRLRRSFRSLVECMVPACCGFQASADSLAGDSDDCHPSSPASTTTTTVTGTFFGYRKGRVSFCLQDDTRSSPLILLEFAVPTAYLAKEMQHGLLRIALECCHQRRIDSQKERCSLFNVPVWSMYCNGRKVAGARDAGDLLMYLRASFERVVGSVDSESFHMINPAGSSGQELSIFLVRYPDNLH